MARRLHLKRYRQIISVLARNGFAVLLEQMGLFSYLRLRRRKVVEKDAKEAPSARLTVGEKLRKSCEELGPTFVKIGQIISTRPDIVSPEIAEELAKLQDSVHPFPFADVENVIGEEFGEPLQDVFAVFDREPLAAASLSQVHRATLPTGKTVAVKVQRPGIDESVKVDLEILEDLLTFVKEHTRYRDLYDFDGMLEELKRTLANELDFRQEGEHADHFATFFAPKPELSVPRIFWIYSTRRVLTMEYVQGVRITDKNRLKELGLDRSQLGRRLADSISEQIFLEGFFHADPHPGNLFVLEDGRLVFLDLGMVGKLSDSRRQILSDMFIGIASQDAHQVMQAFLDMDSMQQRVNLHRFENEIERLLEQYMSLPIEKIKIGEILADLFQMAFQYKIKIPGSFTLIAKVLITLQNSVETLDPEINLLQLMKPMVSRLLRDRYSLDRIGHEIKRTGSDYHRLVRTLPSFLVNFFHKVEDDEFSLQLKLKDLEKILKHLEGISNRISFSLILLGVSIIIAGIIVGSSLSAGIGLEVTRFSQLIFRGGLVMAGIILIGLLISMIRSQRF